jgi:hypothetical protein
MTKDEALKLIADIASGSTTANSLQHIAKIALEALAQPEQEPVAWEQFYPDIGKPKFVAQQEQEPVVWMYQDKSTHEVRFQKHMRGFVDHGATYETPLYTTPPQRTWVGMSEEKKRQFVVSYYSSNWDRKTAIALMDNYEAYLKEKNNG